MIIFGPVPSRRLGQSIGINNIPPKTCSYSCVYCQLGRTDKMQIKREEFYKPEIIYSGVFDKLKKLEQEGKIADFLTFVPDGEPTLDKNLGTALKLLKKLNTKTAVISNASLIFLDEVKQDLLNADWVSLKIDAADEETFSKIDRPFGKLKLSDILTGIYEFSKIFKGTLVTETMLVEGINDSPEVLREIGQQLLKIKPETAYLLIPTRPPAESNVKRCSPGKFEEAFHILKEVSGVNIVCITGDEDEEGFFFTENLSEDILSITSVHPVRVSIIEDLLKRRNADRKIIDLLIQKKKLLEFSFEGKKFYRKNLEN